LPKAIIKNPRHPRHPRSCSHPRSKKIRVIRVIRVPVLIRVLVRVPKKTAFLSNLFQSFVQS
jgi:hypothetical protein